MRGDHAARHKSRISHAIKLAQIALNLPALLIRAAPRSTWCASRRSRPGASCPRWGRRCLRRWATTRRSRPGPREPAAISSSNRTPDGRSHRRFASSTLPTSTVCPDALVAGERERGPAFQPPISRTKEQPVAFSALCVLLERKRCQAQSQDTYRNPGRAMLTKPR
jgi:hypothetical protein